MIDTPVLFITFARPEYAQRSFNAIKDAKPKKLYFYSNKARGFNDNEIERNNSVRNLVSKIDWECELKVFFREEYVDVYTSLWSAIDWVFDNEEQAIILEEDCVASVAFFYYCNQLLNKYKDDLRIWVISGNNVIEGFNPNSYDYFFNSFPYLYGWASWRNRWQRIWRDRIPIEAMIEYKVFDQVYLKRKAARQAEKFVYSIIETRAWDHRFLLTMKCNGGVGVIPKVNLVENIGIIGEHNQGKKNIFQSIGNSGQEIYKIDHEPPFVISDYSYTQKFYSSLYLRKRNLLQKLSLWLSRSTQNSKKS